MKTKGKEEEGGGGGGEEDEEEEEEEEEEDVEEEKGKRDTSSYDSPSLQYAKEEEEIIQHLYIRTSLEMLCT